MNKPRTKTEALIADKQYWQKRFPFNITDNLACTVTKIQDLSQGPYAVPTKEVTKTSCENEARYDDWCEDSNTPYRYRPRCKGFMTEVARLIRTKPINFDSI